MDAEKVLDQIRGMIGKKYLWEPNSPSALEEVEVLEVNMNDECEIWICAANEKGQRCWNELTRFLEAISI